jgi:lysophospholipase L1-like esterase
MRCRLVAIAAFCAAATAALGACGGSPAASPAPSPSPRPLTYAAVGASDTVGIGATNPSTDAWPVVFSRTALPASAVFRNFGVSGEKAAGALTDELPKALLVKPSLVTVWLNVNDLIAGVAPAAYHDQLGQLVHGLRQGGRARVLVANTPHLESLPVFLRCRAGTSFLPCPGRIAALTPEVLDTAVVAYNTAIADVVQREGAELVDLYGQGDVAAAHPDWVGRDGFHPSTAGYVQVAGLFATTYLGRKPSPKP